MPTAAFKDKLARIEALRCADAGIAAAGLRKALADRSNFVIAKAAAIAGERYVTELIPDLLAAYDRLFGDAIKRDPLALGKRAIAQALRDLDHQDADAFVRGLRHVQFEPVWGGSEDHAGDLRATCAHALVACNLRALDLLTMLIEHLVDPLKIVRIEVVRAIAQVGGHESLLLLRLKALAGDRDADVLGACFVALLERDRHDGVAFVTRYLSAEDADIVIEAASALAASRDIEALDSIRHLWPTDISLDLRRAIIFSCAASPLADAADFLLSIVADRRADLAVSAISALGASRYRNDVRERTRTIAGKSAGPAALAAFARAFGPDPP